MQCYDSLPIPEMTAEQVDPASWLLQALITSIIAPGIGLLQRANTSLDIPANPMDPSEPDISGLLALHGEPGGGGGGGGVRQCS